MIIVGGYGQNNCSETSIDVHKQCAKIWNYGLQQYYVVHKQKLKVVQWYKHKVNSFSRMFPIDTLPSGTAIKWK